jgi:regulatory protein
MISQDIRNKVERYCAYQERCQEEVRQKLSALGLKGAMAEQLIAELIATRFISEERFARAFARGKFKNNHWGRRKIEAALLAKKVSKPCIKTGLQEIRDNEYRQTLQRLIEKPPVKTAADARKRFRQLVAKGFEPALIHQFLNAPDAFSDIMP